MPTSYCFGSEGNYELHGPTRKLLRNGAPVALGARAFDLLWALVEAGGSLVTKNQLLLCAWPGLVVEEANVYVTVAQLRKLLGADAIATVGGLGYRFALPLAPVGEDSPRRGLPAPRTSFVGRDRALVEALALLHGTRLMTLTGIGGTGKTRLALELAQRALPGHRHGACWLDLAPMHAPQQLAPALASAFGFKPSNSTQPLVAVAASCRDLDLLLVLDNCEHLLDAVAQAADTLLAAAPGLCIVATSREALGLAGEVILPVKPLELPAADAATPEIVGNEAVRLFVERARSAAPAAVLDANTAPVVGEICRRLDGLPLALELAAARMKVLSAPQLLALLDSGLLLADGSRARPRQQTLQAVIGWSYDAADPAAQAVLRAMSVCSAGCDFDAAVALMGEPSRPAAVADGLQRLLDQGLLSVRHGADSARYTTLETVRQYALERLAASGEAASVRERHRNHFLRLAEEADRECRRHLAAGHLRRLEAEHDNLMQALHWCAAPGGGAVGLRFVVAMRGYWSARGMLRLGRDLSVDALARTGADRPDGMRSAALAVVATLCWWLGEPAEARGYGEESLAIARQLDDRRLMGMASRALSYAHGALGHHDQAGSWARESLRLAREEDDAVELCHALVAVADHEFESGELARSGERFEEVVRLCELNGHQVGHGVAALALAEIAIERQQADVARDWLEIAGRLAQTTRSRYLGQHLIERSASLAALMDDGPNALRWFSASAMQRRATGLSDQTMSLAQRLRSIALAREALGPVAAARAESAGTRINYPQTLAEVQAWLERPVDTAGAGRRRGAPAAPARRSARRRPA